MRHAHSHLGYFGLLFPLAWLGWRELGAAIPGPRISAVYGAATVLATVGFLRPGYGPDAIVGSTVVAAIWLLSAWWNRARLADLHDPLGAMLPAVILCEACVPPIAYFLRRDPELAHGLVSTFLALLLLAVIVPSALATHRVRLAPWPLLLVAAVLTAAALGVAPTALTRAGAVGYAAIVGSVALRDTVAPHHRIGWALLALGLLVLGVGLLPNHRPVAIGALHLGILGPVLFTLVEPRLARRPSTWGWLIGLAAVGVLAGSLIVQGLGWAAAGALRGAAVGGTPVAAWWAGLLLAQHDLPWPRRRT